MSFKAGAVKATETCSCGAHIEVAAATGWMDSHNVQQQLESWRRNHQHTVQE